MKINNFGQKIEKFVMLTFEFLHFETLFFSWIKNEKIEFQDSNVNQLLFSAPQDFDVWNRSASAAPAGGPALLSYATLHSRVLLLSRDLLCTGCCTINGLGIAWCPISVKLKKSIFMAIFWYLNLWMIRNKLDVQS